MVIPTQIRKGLLVYGDVNIDIHLKCSYNPQVSQDTIVEDINFEFGGSAANCAAIASKLGIPTTFIGFVGKDAYGIQCKQDLSSFGVSTDYLFESDGKTGIVISIIDPTGEHFFYSFRGANAIGRLISIPIQLFKNQKFLHLSGYSFQDPISRSNALQLIEQATKAGVAISLDPSYWYAKEYHASNREVLNKVNILFPNVEEAQLMSGIADTAAASRALIDCGPNIVIVKMGQEGCLITQNSDSFFLPAVPVLSVKDTTGAGDAFCGACLAGKIYDLNDKEAAKVGNIVAAKVIQSVGGHKGAPAMEELIKLLVENHAEDIAQKLSV